MTTQAVQESLSGAHAPMSKVFPGKITTTVGTRNAYVQSDGDVVVMCVGEDAEERAKTVARAIASHDKLVAMVQLLEPSWGDRGVRVTITPDAFNRLDRLLRPPLGMSHLQQFGRAVRPVPVIDRKLSDEELQELISTGASEVVFMPSTADDEAPGEADHLCKLALAEVIEECDAVRAELKATGHAHEGHPLHRLVDAAIDRREEVDALKERLARIRFVAA
ncbi:hypothetical protein EOB36_20470 [Mesorhizobium sp. M6A.T.Cr.TU.017.01.1.1]|uniref:hypothetical protein n=1 Tax=Mesorhizobium sp. M6A.T.Cr.TU.017.01.1.1 TaxID=2496774 RepID=UPI000FD2FE4B|nr:hypothetical protein [Mesorhizobium sp. M6A.T.Cr.TU.017.01.1.1]RUU99454.1 hypothetical protein EOB36_20470 [Mesorhizobium sp. M6A.T.Cr.TU.017.01.1.1]